MTDIKNWNQDNIQVSIDYIETVILLLSKKVEILMNNLILDLCNLGPFMVMNILQDKIKKTYLDLAVILCNQK